MKFAFFAACCAFALPIVARADAPDAAMQQALQSNYQLACAAALNPTDDALQAMFGILAPDFTDTNVSGDQISRAQVVDQFGSQLKMFHITTCDQKLASTQSAPDGTVIATDVLHMTGAAPMEGTDHTYALSTTSQDTWSNASGRWLIVHRIEKHVRIEQDGTVLTDQGS